MRWINGQIIGWADSWPHGFYFSNFSQSLIGIRKCCGWTHLIRWVWGVFVIPNSFNVGMPSTQKMAQPMQFANRMHPLIPSLLFSWACGRPLRLRTVGILCEGQQIEFICWMIPELNPNRKGSSRRSIIQSNSAIKCFILCIEVSQFSSPSGYCRLESFCTENICKHWWKKFLWLKNFCDWKIFCENLSRL